MNFLLKSVFISILLTSLSACESGMFIRGSHSHYYHEDNHNQPIRWGYTVGDPVLEAGYYGNFYPLNSPYGPIIRQGEGAVAP